MTKQALIELREALTTDEQLYVAKIATAFGPFEEPNIGNAWTVYNAWQGSLDAAVAFLEAVLPEWTVNNLHQKRHPTNGMKPTGEWECLLFAALKTKFAHAEAKADTPARALLLATLDVLIEGAE